MSWYKVTISAHQPDFYQFGKIQDKFLKIFIILRGPKDMALLSSGFSHSDTFNFYFTPACDSHPAMKSLLDSCGAVPCDEPTRDTEKELGLSVGYTERWRDYIWSPDYYVEKRKMAKVECPKCGSDCEYDPEDTTVDDYGIARTICSNCGHPFEFQPEESDDDREQQTHTL
ncbi:MAG TPA: hypothetical protein VMW72_02665 [Sedimentisphaerales bacterium]|nr:hypothetical protein [Sedimentisphaerales bacterium]